MECIQFTKDMDLLWANETFQLRIRRAGGEKRTTKLCPLASIWIWPERRIERYGEEKNIFLLQLIELLVVSPVAYLLYRLECPGSQTLLEWNTTCEILGSSGHDHGEYVPFSSVWGSLVAYLALWGGVWLRPLGTSATNWPIVPIPDDRWRLLCPKFHESKFCVSKIRF
jgi:hypothetical protein